MMREMLLAAAALAQSVGTTVPIGFLNEAIAEHQLGGDAQVALPAGARAAKVDVRVTIAPDGSVIDARPAEEGNAKGVDPTAALAAARALRFRPFLYRGVPVTAAGIVEIDLVPAPAQAWRDQAAELPPIDYDHLKITLVRSACFGSCPDYRVTIDGAGNVVFSTQEESVPGAAEVHRAYSPWTGVLIPGTHRTTIDRATLDALIAKFRAAHFFGLRKEYFAGVTDNPTYVVGFESGGRSWVVQDYVGQMVGMPSVVTELERAIDEAADTTRWVQGDASTVPALIADDFDPRSEDAQYLALLSATPSNGRVALDLVTAGLPLDAEVRLGERRAALGAALLEAAVGNGRTDLFEALVARGALARMPRATLDDLFAGSGGGCDPAIARAMVAAGADPRARTSSDPHDMGYSAGRKTALITALHAYPCERDDRRVATAAELIRLGVDVNAVNDHGESAIFGLEDLDLLEQLLAAGARVDIKDRNGNSAVFSSWTDAIVLRLLDAGADPNGYYDDGGKKSLRQMARERDMLAVLAWLDAHGIG